jgi:hypothetical protein
MRGRWTWFARNRRRLVGLSAVALIVGGLGTILVRAVTAARMAARMSTDT